MKTIGIIGGTTWYSSADYYRYINEMVHERLGDYHSARIILNSVDYDEIKKYTYEGDWKTISKIICKTAKQTEEAGADCILLAANTLHYIAGDVENAISVPFIHIARETAKEINKLQINNVALLGTKYTMQQNFFIDILSVYGIKTLIPPENDIETLNTAIYDELSKGIILDPTKKSIIEIIDKLAGHGADGVILGCTEIPLLIKEVDCPLPVFDTAKIHARAAVNFALMEDEAYISKAI